tara:strand:- start:1329 stop:2270 length:942 start_codon:yes stop_codon:yes gene_type:complete
MILIKPKFWDQKINFLTIFLLPLSLIFIFIIFLKKKFTKSLRFKIPIICVGNIFLGGTGKTPISVFLAKEISKLGKKTVILRRYYKNHKDEYKFIKSKFKNLILNKNRISGLEIAEKSNFDVAILDDGLQDYRIRKNLSIVCFNQNQLIGNGFVLPSGPLRETLNALKNANIVIINGDKDKYFERKILNVNKKLEVFYSSYIPLNINEFKNKKLLAIAGIGNPENFFKLIEKNKLKLEKKIIFPDHYEFSKNEIQNIVDEATSKNCQIIMTEKDYFKVKHFKIRKIKFLKVLLKIDNQKMLLNKIKELYDKNN